MNLMPFTITWVAIAGAVLVLFVYRSVIARKDDETVHIHDSEAALVAQQAVTARKLEAVDKWGKILTVVALLYGLAIGAVYMVKVWNESGKAGL